MSIRVRATSNPVIAALLVFLLLNPVVTASANTAATPAPVLINPVSMVNTRGSTLGAVASLRTQDQSGTADTPAKYVMFQTPGVTYQGYRTFTVPATVGPGTVTNVAIKVNYKGPAKATQTWSWSLYDWVQAKWIKVGDNTGATLNVWKVLQFSVTTNPTRFINNATRQVRLQITSSNAGADAKLDYEGITLSYVSCSDPLGCVLVKAGQPMHITYLLSMPGFETPNGVRLAADQAAAILGHTILVDGVSRTDCNDTIAAADARTMIRDASILAVIGTTCSYEAFQVMPVLSPVGFSMVSPSNTNAGLTDPGTPGYLRVAWNDDQQGELAAEYAVNLGATKAATIGDNGDYASGLIQAFNDAFTNGGGTITAQKTIAIGQTDMRPELTDIETGSPEMVYMPLFMPEGGFVINQAGVILGPPGTVHLVGSDGLHDANVVLATGSDLDGFAVTAIDWTQFSPAYTDPGGFVDQYLAKYGAKPQTDGFAPYGYDAFNVIKAAIESAAVSTGGGAHLIGRQALRNALYATSGFAGLTGTITCQPDGDCAATPALGVFQYAAGVDDPVKVWP
jgi:branched-chain amino acid transport system substrate-binding protein